MRHIGLILGVIAGGCIGSTVFRAILSQTMFDKLNEAPASVLLVIIAAFVYLVACFLTELDRATTISKLKEQ